MASATHRVHHGLQVDDFVVAVQFGQLLFDELALALDRPDTAPGSEQKHAQEWRPSITSQLRSQPLHARAYRALLRSLDLSTVLAKPALMASALRIRPTAAPN